MQEEINTSRADCCSSDKIKEENKKLCDKYPFLTWYGNPLYSGYSEKGEPDYSFTWEDEIPEGWRKAFCPQMWDELKEILEKHNCLDSFKLIQLKEKWGVLRIYDNGAPKEAYDEIEAWEAKYEKLSKEACIKCGKPAKYLSAGWISPWCEDCAKEINDAVIKIEDAEDFYNVPREEREKFIVKF